MKKARQARRRIGTIAALAVAALVAAATAAAVSVGPASKAAAKTLVYAITSTPPNIDPNSSAQFVESEVFTNTMSRLFDFKTVKRPDGTYVMQSAGYQPIVGSLATHWTVSPNKKVITVDLRKGVKNFLGHSFDVKDVRYTFDRLVSLNGTGTNYLHAIGITKPSNIVVLNRYKVQFRLDFPAELFFKMMSIPHMGIEDSVEFKKHATKSDPWSTTWAHTHNVGWGPYYITQNQQGVQTVLQRDPNFWGHRPDIDTVIEKEVPNSSNRLALLKGGAVDIAAYLEPRELVSLKNDPNVQVVSFAPAQAHSILYMANEKKPFTNKLVRQAICQAIPYENIVKAVGFGLARWQKSPLPANYQYYAPQLDPYNGDIEKAKALLKKAGYPHGFSSTLAFSNDDPTIEQQAGMLQNALSQIGVKVSLNKLPFATFTQGWFTERFQMGMASEGAFIPDFTYALNLWYYGPKKNNFLNFADYYNPRVNKLLDKSKTTFSEPERKKLALEIQKVILQDAPMCYMVEPGAHFPARKNIGGINYFTYSALHFDLLTKK